jgi:hypothetical protein
MPSDNIDALARAARRAAANTLAALSVVRGADYAGDDAVERAILAMAAPDIDAAASSSTGASGGEGSKHAGSSAAGGYDIASASEWPAGVKKDDVLITPAEARSAWREFMHASTLAVQQVRGARLAAGQGASRHPTDTGKQACSRWQWRGRHTHAASEHRACVPLRARPSTTTHARRHLAATQRTVSRPRSRSRPTWQQASARRPCGRWPPSCCSAGTSSWPSCGTPSTSSWGSSPSCLAGCCTPSWTSTRACSRGGSRGRWGSGTTSATRCAR